MNETSGPTDTPEFPDLPAFVSVLNRHGVRYVVIGGYVAQGFISGYVTHDVDFTPATDRENLDRLSAALTELGARMHRCGERRSAFRARRSFLDAGQDVESPVCLRRIRHHL